MNAGEWTTDGGAPAGTPAGQQAAQLVAERPEIAVGAAFLGGLIVARILKRLGG